MVPIQCTGKTQFCDVTAGPVCIICFCVLLSYTGSLGLHRGQKAGETALEDIGEIQDGAVLGVAVDIPAGTMLFAFAGDGMGWRTAFASDVSPGYSVGAALFPAISGEIARVRFNSGLERPMVLGPPSPDFVPVGKIVPELGEQVSHTRHAGCGQLKIVFSRLGRFYLPKHRLKITVHDGDRPWAHSLGHPSCSTQAKRAINGSTVLYIILGWHSNPI